MSKRNTKDLDKDLSSDSEEEEEQVKKTTKGKKKVESDDSSSEEDKKVLKNKTKRESSDDAESESEKPKKNTKKTPAKKEDSDDDDSDSDVEEVKPKKSAKKAPAKKEDSDVDDDSDEEESEKPKKSTKKAPVKKEDSDDDDEEEEKPKKSAKKEESDEEEEEDKKEDDNEALPENAFEELFVRNLSYNTTQESLAEYFGKYGDVEEVKILYDKTSGKSRGMGFCKFYQKSSAVKAMKDSSNLELDGRKLEIRYSNDKAPRENQNKSSKSTGFSIFVGNLSFKCTEKGIRNFFSECGNVVDVRIAKNEDGKLKGFAHVDFDSKEAVEKAIKKNGEELDGRKLRIDESTPKQGGNGGRGRGRGGRGGRGRGQADPLSKAKKSGAIIAPTESKVTVIDSDDDE